MSIELTKSLEIKVPYTVVLQDIYTKRFVPSHCPSKDFKLVIEKNKDFYNYRKHVRKVIEDYDLKKEDFICLMNPEFMSLVESYHQSFLQSFIMDCVVLFETIS